MTETTNLHVLATEADASDDWLNDPDLDSEFVRSRRGKLRPYATLAEKAAEATRLKQELELLTFRKGRVEFELRMLLDEIRSSVYQLSIER